MATVRVTTAVLFGRLVTTGVAVDVLAVPTGSDVTESDTPTGTVAGADLVLGTAVAVGTISPWIALVVTATGV